MENRPVGSVATESPSAVADLVWSHSFRSHWSYLLPFLRDELHAHLRSIDSNQFASAICQSGGGQQQEELLDSKHFERAFDFQPGTGGGYVEKDAASPPGAVNAHQVDGAAMLHPHAFRLSIP